MCFGDKGTGPSKAIAPRMSQLEPPGKGSPGTGGSETPRQSNKTFSSGFRTPDEATSSTVDGASASKPIEVDSPPPSASLKPAQSKDSKLPPSHKNSTLEPHDNDVLCGRGGSINTHPGNEHFRQLVERRKRVYLTARFKREKRLIASSIVSDIRNLNPPGRFLTRDSKTGVWLDIGDEKARDKTSQALRENAPSIRAEMETEINKRRAEMQREEEEEAARRAAAERAREEEARRQHWYGGGGGGYMHGGYQGSYRHDAYDGRWGHDHQRPSGYAEQHRYPASGRRGDPSHPQAPPPPSHSLHPSDSPPEERKSAFDIPKMMESVPSSFAAWTKSSFSFGSGAGAGGGEGSDHRHERPERPHSPIERTSGGRSSSHSSRPKKPLTYQHSPAYGRGDRDGRERTVHFQASTDEGRHYRDDEDHYHDEPSPGDRDYSSRPSSSYGYHKSSRGGERDRHHPEHDLRYRDRPSSSGSSRRYHDPQPLYHDDQHHHPHHPSPSRGSFSPPPHLHHLTISSNTSKGGSRGDGDMMDSDNWSSPSRQPVPPSPSGGSVASSTASSTRMQFPKRRRYQERPKSPYSERQEQPPPYYDNYDRRTPPATRAGVHPPYSHPDRPSSMTYPQAPPPQSSPTPPPSSSSSSKREHHHQQHEIETQSSYKTETGSNVGSSKDTSTNLLTQVAQHILSSWDGGSTSAAPTGSSAQQQEQNEGFDNASQHTENSLLDHGHTVDQKKTQQADSEEGQEVELVEMMDTETVAGAEHPFMEPPVQKGSNEEETRIPPEERQAVEVDWGSKVGGCHTWISESLTAASFFTSGNAAGNTPGGSSGSGTKSNAGTTGSRRSSAGAPPGVSPVHSIEMEMDGISLCGTDFGTDVGGNQSCAGSVGGGSLCHVFDERGALMSSPAPHPGSSLMDNGAYNTALSLLDSPKSKDESAREGHSSSRSSGGGGSGRYTIGPVPSWERTFLRSRSPSPYDEEEDRSLMSKDEVRGRSHAKDDAVDPSPSLTYSQDTFSPMPAKILKSPRSPRVGGGKGGGGDTHNELMME